MDKPGHQARLKNMHKSNWIIFSRVGLKITHVSKIQTTTHLVSHSFLLGKSTELLGLLKRSSGVSTYLGLDKNPSICCPEITELTLTSMFSAECK